MHTPQLPDPATFNEQSAMDLARHELLRIHEVMTFCGVPTATEEGAAYSASQRVVLFVAAWGTAGKAIKKAAGCK